MLAPALALLVAAAPPAPGGAGPSGAVAGGGEDAGPYLRGLRARCHTRWVDNFLALAGSRLPPEHPLNERARSVVLDVTLAPTGKLAEARVTTPSGLGDFDGGAVDVTRDASPFPAPPLALLSDDGSMHVRWTFARDERGCSGVELVRQEAPLDRALPGLLRSNGRAEALRRVAAARRLGGAEPALTLLARAWLGVALERPAPPIRAAAALSPDSAALQVLRAALLRSGESRTAAVALARAKEPICPLVKDALGGGEPARSAAVQALAATGGEDACGDALVAVLGNLGALPETRAAAAEALGSLRGDRAHAALVTAAKDPAKSVRAAANLALARPGGGRPAVVRLAPLLNDPEPEVRAAGVAGMVRTGGDEALPQLFVLFKEKDPRPGEAAARELGKMSTPESAKLLGRLIKREQPGVRLAAAEALSQRRDASAQTVLHPLLGDGKTPADVRAFAVSAADSGELAKLAGDEILGAAVYRAWLRLGERDAAADWLLPRLAALPEPAAVDLLADWLVAHP